MAKGVFPKPQSALLKKLSPIVDGLARRGAACQAIEFWTNHPVRPDQVGFTLTAVFASEADASRANHMRLLADLVQHGFHVRHTSSSDIGERDIHVTATMKVPQDGRRTSSRCGKRFRNAGKRRAKPVRIQ
jgi:hypothetical protein